MTYEIILGNRLNDDGSMSETMLARLNKGIEVFNELKPDMILVCGGPANPLANATEASKMKEFLVNKGIKGNKIMLEDKSMTTLENGKFAKKILKKQKIEKIYLVSSDYHFERKHMKCHKIFKFYFPFVPIIRCSCANVK